MKQDWEIDPKDLILDKPIGEGGFALVYQGTYQDRPVAVKKLNIKLLSGHLLDKFKKEVRSLFKLRHENIVMVFGACISFDANYIVMELLPYRL